MRKRFQFILTFSLIVIFQIAFWSFTFLAKKYITYEIVEQVKYDNKVIGEQLIKVLAQTGFTGLYQQTDTVLQHVCDEIMLPNGGFICAIDTKGNLVAAPNLKAGMTMPFAPILKDFNNKKHQTQVKDLKSTDLFEGLAFFKEENRTDIVSSIPINSELRLFVHQNNDIIQQKANQYVKPLFIIGLIVTIVVGLFSFLTSNKIINSYESQIELQHAELKDAIDEIHQQKENIIEQNKELEKQRNIAQNQHDMIVLKNKDINDSINYAKRIQTATLPNSELDKSVIEEHFILFLPRNVVSGDFYWYHELDDYIIITAVDCTGHGVPGAFMSMIGVTFLNEIIIEKNIIDAGQILNMMRDRVINALDQKNKTSVTHDGMDMAISVIEKSTKKMQFAGAFNPMICIRNNEVLEIKGDRMPIGIYAKMDNNFKTHYFDLQSDDRIYLFSDGYQDQFGGSDGRKFLIKNFRHLLVEINKFPMSEQKEVLDLTFSNWKGEFAQVDDILVIGLKIK
ncbi:MAG: SpoIIE family protein phosphatase [Bacteroidales bacterium]|nr:SpoIIE family protein phosphatase [Bacteroidales bacterium]MBN2757261.1 SpoIIE family protein phosphatase [Bacteroidales bacterium]